MNHFEALKKFFKDNFIYTRIINPNEISDPIAQAIKDKEIPNTDFSLIAKPILRKLTGIQDAIELKEKQESISVMSEVVSALQDLLKKETQITVEPAKTDISIDISAILKGLDSLKKAIPTIKMPEIKDYSSDLLEIVTAIKDKKGTDYSAFFAKIEEVLYNINSTIQSKETKEYPFEFDESNRLKVNVDRAGGGGVLNKEESDKLLSLDTPRATRIVESGNYIYIGKAPIGSATSSAVWQVKRVDTTSGAVILWADGDGSFDNVFDDYATLSYL